MFEKVGKWESWKESKDISPPPPICTVPTWGKKYHFGKGWGEGRIRFFGEIYTPELQCSV